MSQVNSDSYRNPLRYQGQDYTFAPLYYRNRSPTVLDTKPKEQTGYYLYGSFWLNTANENIWVLTGFITVGGVLNANWTLISFESTAAILEIGVPNGSTPIVPDADGLVNFTSSLGSVVITGSAGGNGAQNINFDLSGFSQGTFVPAIQGSTNAGSPVYTSQIGRYQKIGRIVTVNYLVSWSSVGGATGNIQCLNLPFTSVNVAGNFVSFIWTDANIAFASGAGNVPVGILAPGNNYWFPYAYNQTTGGNSQIAIPSTGGITATIIYETE